MGFFPFAAPLPSFTPRFVNIGAFQVNTVTNNSILAIGDGSLGDVLCHHKLNQGFGIILGNANIIPANANLVCDPDVFDQTGSINQGKLTTRLTD